MYALIYITGFLIVLIFGIIDSVKSDHKLTFSGLVEILGWSAFSVVIVVLVLIVLIGVGIYELLKNVTVWEKK